MAGLSETELHHKIVETLQKGEDPKPFVKDWCIPTCPKYQEMLNRCEQALKIVQVADPEKTCLYRYRQWVECVENCVQPKIFHNLVSAHNRGKLDGFFDTVWTLRYLFAPLYPFARLAVAFKRVNSIEGPPIEWLVITFSQKMVEEVKRQTGWLSKEVLALTGGLPSMKPSVSRKALQGLKERRAVENSDEKWVWAGFTNSARQDNLVLHHWVKESEKGEDYPFAKFDKKIELVELNDELYESFGNGTEWGKEETFYLWQLAEMYDLRFIVMQDRWDTDRFPQRTVEDLKERYYQLSRQILMARGENEHQIVQLPFNAKYEKRRKALLEKYFLRTKEQDDEERALCEEARKLDIRIKKEEKEMKNYEKLMQADTDIELPEWIQGMKKITKGPHLRSQQLGNPQLPPPIQKRIDLLLTELGIPLRPNATEDNLEVFTQIRKQMLMLIHLQKFLVKRENEKKMIEDRIREARQIINKKQVSNAPQNQMRMPLPMQEPKQQVIQAVRGTGTRQTIGPMNNLQQNIGMGKHQAGMMQAGSRRGKDVPEPYKRQKKGQ